MDDDGQIYAVMVPDVCGNVAVLGERYAQPEPLPSVAGVRATQRHATHGQHGRRAATLAARAARKTRPPPATGPALLRDHTDAARQTGSGADKTVALRARWR